MTNATVVSAEGSVNPADAFAESLARADREEMPDETEIAASPPMHGRQAPPSPDVLLDGFYAETPLGRVAFGIRSDDDETAQAVTDPCLRAALCLGRAEALIRQLEDWLGVPLDLEPGAMTPPRDDQLKVTWTPPDSETEAAVKKAVMHLPLDALAHLAAPSAALAEAMRWETLPCQVTVSSAAVPQRQLALLEPGGLVLIPASFEPFWRCQARLCARPALAFSAELDAGQQRLIFEPYQSKTANQPAARLTAETPAADAELTDIVLRQRLPIAVDRLTGWAEQPLFELERTLAAFEVEISSPQGVLAHGDLMPVGNGYGVFVRAITAVQRQPAGEH
ncbi:MAG: hypothetical protein L3K24_12740 [Gammaproteobacteria bacterium]|nr:hypothetical protein [Gammaproteobacteria bacterium]